MPSPVEVARFLFGLRGRVGRKGIWLGLLLPYLAGSLILGGVDATAQLVWGLVFLWPLSVAVPIKRFRDMGRAWWWVPVFLGGIAFGLGYLWYDLSQSAAGVGMTAWAALGDIDRYASLAEAAVARGERSAARGPLLTAAGFGGLSTALIFFFIEFGWLYLIPGRTTGVRPDGSPN